MSDTVVRSETEGVITTITLDSPENRNALSSRLLEQLTLALEAANSETSTRVVVITGAGNTFCAGADLEDQPGNTPGQQFSFPDILKAILLDPQPVMTPRAFRRYVITGEVFDGAEAERNGLVTRCVPREELDSTVATMAEELRKAA